MILSDYMKFLRSFYYLYLSLLPALTYPAIVMADAQHISGWYNLLFFFVVILYLPLINTHSHFPKTWSAAIVTTLAVPVQIFLALYFGHFANIWLLFAYQFLIEAGGLLIGGVLAGAFGQFGNKQISLAGKQFMMPNAKQWASLLILVVPMFVLLRMFAPMFTDSAWGWSTFFLFTALMTAANNKFISYKTNPGADGMENISTMVLGFLSLIFLGPFLGAIFGNN